MSDSTQQLHIIFSPHFDDAVFSLGGFITTHASRVYVVTCFAGMPERPIKGWWDRYISGFADSTVAVSARTKENKDALTILGLSPSQIINLAYLDNQYNAAPEYGDFVPVLANAMEKIINDFPGQSLVLYAPLTAIHPDHRRVREAMREVVKRERGNGRVSFVLYQDLPYTFSAYLRSFCAHPFVSERSRLRSLPQYLLEDKKIKTDFTLYAHDNIVAAQKKAAIRAYTSQVRGMLRFFGIVIKIFSSLQRKIEGKTRACVLVEGMYEVVD